jgi:hypothetical protein
LQTRSTKRGNAPALEATAEKVGNGFCGFVLREYRFPLQAQVPVSLYEASGAMGHHAGLVRDLRSSWPPGSRVMAPPELPANPPQLPQI